jgi:hypothetical protein
MRSISGSVDPIPHRNRVLRQLFSQGIARLLIVSHVCCGFAFGGAAPATHPSTRPTTAAAPPAADNRATAQQLLWAAQKRCRARIKGTEAFQIRSRELREKTASLQRAEAEGSEAEVKEARASWERSAQILAEFFRAAYKADPAVSAAEAELDAARSDDREQKRGQEGQEPIPLAGE